VGSTDWTKTIEKVITTQQKRSLQNV